MKIAMDGFALGLAEGTGITRYALELSRALTKRQHQVFPVYGLNGIGRIPELLWPRFIQSLMLRGEAGRHDISRWAFFTALHSLHYVTGRPLRGQVVPPDDRIATMSVANRLPDFAKLYNVPSIYRSAQAYSYLFRHPLRVVLDEKIDIWHLTQPLPVRIAGAKCVVTAHDIIPITLPHSTAVYLRHYHRIIRQTYAHADMIFAVSEQTKRDLKSHFDIPEHKILVTYQSVDIPRPLIEAPPAEIAGFVKKAFGLNYGNYFLFYGAIEPKKNVLRVIEAMCTANTNMPIVIAGKSGWLDQDVTALIGQLRERDDRNVIRINYLPYNQLMYLLKGARGLVFPSLYEGFGIPALEAMLMGCPVITSNSPPLTEVCGDAALYVDPLKPREIADAIDAVATNENLRAELIERGRAQAIKFSPDRYVSKLEEGYRLALQT